jgi:hypothetical protein
MLVSRLTTAVKLAAVAALRVLQVENAAWDDVKGACGGVQVQPVETALNRSAAGEDERLLAGSGAVAKDNGLNKGVPAGQRDLVVAGRGDARDTTRHTVRPIARVGP